MSKNIWIINQYAGSTYHGKEYRSPSIARELIKNGYKVTIISTSHSHHFKSAPKVSKTFTLKNVEGINYLWVQTKKYSSSKSYKRIWNMFEFLFKCYFLPLKIIDKPDYIIVSSPSLLPILNGIYYKKKFNTKLIFEVRDLWPLSVVELGNISSKNFFIQFLSHVEKSAYKYSDLVVSLLSNAKEYMVARGLEEKKFLYIPNGIDLQLLNNRKEAPLRIIKQINKSKFLVGYAGSLGIANNLYALIDSAELLKEKDEIVFVLLGSGSEEIKLKEYANTKNLKNIIFPGSVEREEVHSTLKYFDVCYLGLQNSNLFKYGVSPTKLYDYMAVSKPILYAIDSENHPVKEAKCGIEVNNAKAEDIACAILEFYKMNQDERDKLGDSGHKKLVENYTFDKLTQKLILAMENL